MRTLHGHGYAFVAAAEDLEGDRPVAAAPRCWIERGSWRQPLGEGVHLLGRDPGAAIPLASALASRQHARIHVAGRAELEDLGSKNGTTLDGRPVGGRVALEDRAEIGIGDERLVVRIVSAAEATQTAKHA